MAAMAKKGDLLVQLDASAEEAQLHSAEADLELAKADRERSRDLGARKVISKAELDAAESKFKQKAAAVDQMRSMITKKTCARHSMVSSGIRQVNVGQMINAGQQVVALTSLDPVFVDFALPQQNLSRLSPGLEVKVHTDAISGREFHGKLTAINSMVDTVTRNVVLQATLENPDHALRPGMFAKVEVILPEKSALVIPGTAVSYAPYGDSVFVIEKKKDEKTGQETQSDPAAICARRRSARRFCFDHERIEGGRNGRRHGRFQIAQRHGRDDQQRSGAKTAAESDAGRYLMSDIRSDRQVPINLGRGTCPPTDMKSFTDLFIKRPVLALVVSFVILIAGLQAMKTINVRQYPRSDIAAITVTTVYVGADAELVARIYHHAARTRDRGRRRHRLHPIAKLAGRFDHHGAPETELRREQGALRHQLESRCDPARSAAGSGDSGHQHRSGRFAVSLRPI